mgnify:CR=1 FL=1
MTLNRLLVVLLTASGLLFGCKKEEKEEETPPAVTASDYLGEYTASAQGSSNTFIINVFSEGGTTLKFVSNWGLYVHQEDVRASFSGNSLTFVDQEFYATSIGTTGGTRRTVSGSGSRSGNSLQMALTFNTYYTPELGGGLYASQLRNISAFRN